jgi:kumamolisin
MSFKYIIKGVGVDMSSKNRISIKGSERTALPEGRIVGAVDPNEYARVTVIVRRRPSGKDLNSFINNTTAQKPDERKHLHRDELAITHGADPADLEMLESFAHEYALDVVEVNAAQRRVVLAGTVAKLSAAFGVYLACYEHPEGTYRGRTGAIHVPEDIAPIVEGVFGLDNRRQARPHFRNLRETGKAVKPHAGEISYTPTQVAQLYHFLQDVKGENQCVAIIELGGGYQTSDLNTYFAKLGIPTPNISSIGIDAGTPDGGCNQPVGDPNSADGEVVLDIEVAGAVAPGARIAVYFAGNTDKGFIDAILTAIHDDLRKPSVISISWGGAEKEWSLQAMQVMNEAFKDAAALGVTVCCAAGDDGSSDLRPPTPDDGLLHVDFPGSSPYVLCCGGTRLEGQGNNITNEVVWNNGRDGGATGGGVSDVFNLPDYQTNANVPASTNPDGRIGRGVPDVAGNADPATGYQILVDGKWCIIGGTSAVAPLWAGLIALLIRSWVIQLDSSIPCFITYLAMLKHFMKSAPAATT